MEWSLLGKKFENKVDIDFIYRLDSQSSFANDRVCHLIKDGLTLIWVLYCLLRQTGIWQCWSGSWAKWCHIQMKVNQNQDTPEDGTPCNHGFQMATAKLLNYEHLALWA